MTQNILKYTETMKYRSRYTNTERYADTIEIMEYTDTVY